MYYHFLVYGKIKKKLQRLLDETSKNCVLGQFYLIFKFFGVFVWFSPLMGMSMGLEVYIMPCLSFQHSVFCNENYEIKDNIFFLYCLKKVFESIYTIKKTRNLIFFLSNYAVLRVALWPLIKVWWVIAVNYLFLNFPFRVLINQSQWC